MTNLTLNTAAKPRWQTWVKAHEVMIFALITVVFSAAVIMLPLPVMLGPVIVVFFPALVAALLIGMTEGKNQIRKQWFSRRQWQLTLKWFIISLAISIALRLAVSFVGLVLVPGYQIQPSSFSVLLLIVLLFAATEEIGWRGFALPRLLERGFAPWKAALVLGIPWGLLHLPLTLPGKLAEGVPLLAQFLSLMGLAVLTSWMFVATKGNILAPTLLHGGQNVFAGLNEGLPLAWNNWLMAIVYCAAAVFVIIFTRGRLGQKQ